MTTYKDLTPGEALDALIRGETIEWCDPGYGWVRQHDRNRTFWAGQSDAGKRYRLVVEQEPDPMTVDDLVRSEFCDQGKYRRIFNTLKAEILAEILEELKK